MSEFIRRHSAKRNLIDEVNLGRSRNLLFGTLLLMISGVFSSSSYATDQYPIVNCSWCVSFGDMAAEANAVAAEMDGGSVFMVANSDATLSAFFRVVIRRSCTNEADPDTFEDYCTTWTEAQAVTADSNAAAALSEHMLAAEIGPISIAGKPGGASAHNLTDAGFEADANTAIRMVAPINLSFSGRFYIVVAGKQITVVPGVTVITVKFSDGTTAKFRCVLLEGSIAWALVPGSERDADGQPLDAAQGGGGAGGSVSPPTNSGGPALCVVTSQEEHYFAELGITEVFRATYWAPCDNL